MKATLSRTTEIPTSDLKFRWIDGYYDGVLSGFASWQGKLCYFQVCDDTGNSWKYTLHRLSDKEAHTAAQEHEAFRQRHGDHNDLLSDGSRAGGTCRTPLKEAAAAGDAITAAIKAGTWQPPASYGNNPIIGWFASSTL